MRSSGLMVFVVMALTSTTCVAGAQGASGATQAPRAEPAMGRAAARPGLLRGLKLSDAEKAKIKSIRDTYVTEAKALRESLKPAREEARAAQQKGDTATLRKVRERTKGDRDKLLQLIRRQTTEVRAALSPENQKQFDTNVQQVRQARAEALKRGGRGTVSFRVTQNVARYSLPTVERPGP